MLRASRRLSPAGECSTGIGEWVIPWIRGRQAGEARPLWTRQLYCLDLFTVDGTLYQVGKLLSALLCSYPYA
jgi:hypothetical protein